MKQRLIVSAASVLVLLGLVVLPTDSHGLTCKQMDFTHRVQYTKNIVIGEIAEIKGGQYVINVVKVLKDGGLLGPKVKSFTVTRSRYTGFSFPVKQGQLVLFFLNEKEYSWTCNGPILIR